MPPARIVHFTDPGCPFAWSAEPARRRLDWLYGDYLEWELRMVGLTERGSDYEDRGFTPERQAASFRRLAGEHHMPIDTSQRPRMAGTMPACRAVVAVRLNRPELEAAMLRALRVEHFSGRLLDEAGTWSAAARRAGLDPADVDRWIAEPSTEEALRHDLRLARSPSREAVAMSHKLARDGDDGWRYTCPSYELSLDGSHLSVPGFQPEAAYEVAVANLMPDAPRREDPSEVGEVLAWAGEPLATAEVAAVCGIELDAAREQLGRLAEEEHLGFDGLWRLRA